jgi:threonine synthase
VFCEAASAASVAGLLKVGASGSRVVCVLTGHGLKEPELAIDRARPPDSVDAELGAVLGALGL